MLDIAPFFALLCASGTLAIALYYLVKRIGFRISHRAISPRRYTLRQVVLGEVSSRNGHYIHPVTVRGMAISGEKGSRKLKPQGNASEEALNRLF